MMDKSIALFFLLISLSGCNNNSSTKVQAINKIDSSSLVILDSTSVHKTKETSSPMDFLSYMVDSAPDIDCQIVNERTVVFVSPDSVQIETMKREEGDTDFYAAADDANWYWSEAHQFLTKKKARVIDADKRYLKFETTSGSIFFDTKADISQGWTVILFRKDSLPRIIESIDIEEGYEKYFGKE